MLSLHCWRKFYLTPSLLTSLPMRDPHLVTNNALTIIIAYTASKNSHLDAFKEFSMKPNTTHTIFEIICLQGKPLHSVKSFLRSHLLGLAIRITIFTAKICSCSGVITLDRDQGDSLILCYLRSRRAGHDCLYFIC